MYIFTFPLFAFAIAHTTSPAERSLSLVSGLCWEEALDFFHAKNLQELKVNINGNNDLQTRRPDRDDPCKHFSDPDKKMMAITMTDCHFRSRQRGGDTIDVPNLPWTDDEAQTKYEQFVNEKLEQFSDLNFHVYLNFYNHLESICFQVQSSLWQSRTDDLIHALSETAGIVASQVEYSAQLNSELISNQELSITQQQTIITDSLRLKQAIEGGQARLQDAFDDIRDEVENERRRFQEVFKDLFDAFQRVLAFQKYLKGRLFDMHTAFFYAFLLFVSHYITATPRTSSSRPQLYMIWSSMALAELVVGRLAGRIRWLVEIAFPIYKPLLIVTLKCLSILTQGAVDTPTHFTAPSQVWPMFEDETTTRHALVSCLRIACAALAATCWFYTFVTYTDPQLKNLNSLTQHIAKMHSQLEVKLLGLKSSQDYDDDPVAKLMSKSHLANSRPQIGWLRNIVKRREDPHVSPPPSRYGALLMNNPQARLLLMQEKSSDFQERLYTNALASKVLAMETF